MSKTFKIVDGDISDGYHTFDELYEHRIALYLALCRFSRFPSYYKQDGDWLCVFLETPAGQISYHLPSKHLATVSAIALHAPEYKWDFHQSHHVIERLASITNQKDTD